MNLVYNPIDMDGVPWTSSVTGIIQDIQIAFYGEGSDNTSGLTKGETKLIDFVVDLEKGWSFSVNAVHPITGKFFRARVEHSGNIVSHPSSISVRVAADIVKDTPIQLSEVSVLPTAVCFFEVPKAVKKQIDLATDSPIVSTILGDTVTIDINETINKYKYVDIGEEGLLRVNGILSTNGNLDIRGAGLTIIGTNPIKPIKNVVGAK